MRAGVPDSLQNPAATERIHVRAIHRPVVSGRVRNAVSLIFADRSKRSTSQEGSRIIGSETNVGCGVITVNYDGYDKHVTRIGDRCMVGCDTQLVAPVTVGHDVYIAYGTTILRDVSDGRLVMSHHPQRETPGWTETWHCATQITLKARGKTTNGGQ